MINCKDCLDIGCPVRNIFNRFNDEKECSMYSPKFPKNFVKEDTSSLLSEAGEA